MILENNKLGSAIYLARLDKHYSQDELAELVDVTPAHIKHMESGHRMPSIEVLSRLVQVLNLSLDDVFFPEPKVNAKFRKAMRLLRLCDERELRLVLALLDAMHGPDKRATIPSSSESQEQEESAH
ncbi:MAG: helix-turn-helix domain protein [Oscillospiraceae bacterium]|nr:helix-turn-helix domain protein [Oscillospiraceae bacterium]